MAPLGRPSIPVSSPLFVLGAFCADVAATNNRTAAMYFMNEVPFHRRRKHASSLNEFHHVIGNHSNYGSHPQLSCRAPT
jgi:hypothetical protein